MTEMCGRTLAMPCDERMICCIGANEENLDHSSPGRLAWYFAQPPIPGLIHLATINGYVASGPDKTKGGKDDV